MKIELQSTAEMEEAAPALSRRTLRGATLCQTLHWLAAGRTTSLELTSMYLDAIAANDLRLNAFVRINPAARDEAAASDARRARVNFGRLDGVPVAVKDNIDVVGLPTACGFPGPHSAAARDARVVERLRGAGAVILGKTQVPEGAFLASSANPHTGATHNPFRPGYQAGGSSSGSAVAVAAGLCGFAVGSDGPGPIRMQASYWGIFSLKPTGGGLSTHGMLRAARRLDSIGLMARSVDDLGVLLHVLDGHDPADARSRRRRVALALPDWEPGNLRVGVLGDLAGWGTEPGVARVFERAMMGLECELGNRQVVDFGDFSITRVRRAALLLIEAEMLVTHAQALASAGYPPSHELNTLLDYARNKPASEYAAADRLLDTAVVKSRQLFSEIDVLVTPTTPQTAFPLEAKLPDNSGDFTCFANFSGCPAVTIPMGNTSDGLPVGLQFMGPPGSDLRLLELAEVCAAALDTAPTYPVGE